MDSKRKTIIILFLTLASLGIFVPRETLAAENPLASPNNKFGIHILDESDLEDAARLVNSNGDWGYVTIVVRKDEKDSGYWQRILNKMRRLHLIPIIRIATRQVGNIWEKPNPEEIDSWVSFLSELNWVVKNRYVVIGNEPNHAKEWGGEVSPEEYADYLESFSKKLKAASSDFFILPAGFDASAPNSKETMDETEFLSRMINYKPNLFDNIDGWTSHSYPNPDFSGSEKAVGRGTLKTFEWELDLLKKLGVKKELPVFITETGWVHKGNEKNSDNSDKSLEEISRKLKYSFNNVWNDPRIVAVTFFLLNYQEKPFDVFSWKKKDGSFYPFYYEVQELPKIKGSPKQVVSVDILGILFPPIIPSGGRLLGIVIVKNLGQNIWLGGEVFLSSYKGLEVEIEPKVILSEIEPGESTLGIIKVKIKR